jgi:hypothetical protein
MLESRRAAGDLFETNSLLAQLWLVRLRKHTETRVGQPAGTRDRALQTGEAWRSFVELFYPLSPIESVRLFENLLRFANYSSFPPARTFFLAYAPLAFEHDVSGEYIGPGVWNPGAGSGRAALRVRRTLRRWCDWLEAFTHLQAHQAHGKSNHPDLDQVIILLWPLVKRHQWSYGDLLRTIGGRPDSGMTINLKFEEQFGVYCSRELGLPSANPAGAFEPGTWPGQEVADRVMKFLPALR